jgi:hypothetical protein
VERREFRHREAGINRDTLEDRGICRSGEVAFDRAQHAKQCIRGVHPTNVPTKQHMPVRRNVTACTAPNGAQAYECLHNDLAITTGQRPLYEFTK